jgi:predicted nucleic acid-binding OB-fold protein
MTLQEALVGSGTISKMVEAIKEVKKGPKFPSFNAVLEKLKELYPSIKSMLEYESTASDVDAEERQKQKMEQLKDIYKRVKQGEIKLQ